LAAVEHDGARVLKVEFHSGVVRAYHGVTRRAYDELMKAPSIGRHFTTRIRDSYPSTAVR
jgi:hypothetical protein